jgi:hypothetical protein
VDSEVARWARRQAADGLALAQELIAVPPDTQGAGARLLRLADPFAAADQYAMDLAILRVHHILDRGDYGNPAWEEFSVVPYGSEDHGCGCVTCHYLGMGGVKAYGPCRTVRLVAQRYRRNPGWRDEWEAR